MAESSATPRAAAGGQGITLREVVCVLGIVSLILAFLAKSQSGEQTRAQQSVAQSMLRDLETAIRAYQSDYGCFPPSNPAADEADNRALVASLALPGLRGTPYYVFRAELLRGSMPRGFERAGSLGEIAGGYGAFPELMSPVIKGLAAGGVDRRIHNFFYRAPGLAFNRGRFELWTGGTHPAETPRRRPPLAAQLAPPVPAQPSEADLRGGVGAGRYYAEIHNFE